MSNNNTIWWLILAGWMIGSTWWHVCKIKLICDAPLISTTAQSLPAKAAQAPLHIMDGPALMLTSNGHVAFNVSDEKADISGIKQEIDSLAAYLRIYPDRQLNIKGYYGSTEINNTNWGNLGIARAESIKSYLVNAGIQPERISTFGQIDDHLNMDNNKISGGIDFEFADAPEANDSTLAAGQKFNDIFRSMDLYFASGSADYIKTTDNESFVVEARKFLNSNPDKKLLITGHTDNTGSADLNLRLSKKRAEHIKNVFTNAGLPAKQLTTDAKGQSQPKAENQTDAGKAANRRVTIVVL
jgi:OOP family OmpA-OmpF porin